LGVSAVVHVWSESEQRAIRDEVDRILKSDAFAQSQRRRTFLSYIVGETLAGRGERLKGYTVAIEVFDRETSFDPAADPVVRIEAGRLRDKLRAYYASEGAHDAIRIDLPKGSYAPVIEFREAVSLEPLLANDALPDAGTDATRLPPPTASIGTRPSIAVLPFVNMSAKRADDYLSDAITENIITALSRFRDLAVAASHSVFSYKSKGRRIPEIARELGVRFVLEGSVQKSKERVTITAQLIDGGAGAHLWAERFDRSYGDLLAVLDEVTEHIVGRLGSPYSGRVGKAWRGQADSGPPKRLRAYDHFLAGLDIFDDWVRGCMPKAREHFFRAIELDPAFGKAYAKIAFSHTLDALLGWSDDAAHSLSEAQKYATLAITHDDDEAWGHWAIGYYSLFVGQHDRAIAGYRRALELNPNDPDIMNDFGLCLSLSGRPNDAVAAVHKAMQLNPHYPDWWLAAVGQVYFDARLYKEAITALERAQTVEMTVNYLYLAACYAAVDDITRAEAATARARALDPNVSLSTIALGFLGLYKEAADREHLRVNLIKAGLLE
jgi:adenylate cyclase